MLWLRGNEHALRRRSMVPEVTHKVPLSFIASVSFRHAVNLRQTQAPLLHAMAYTLLSTRLCDNYCSCRILIHNLIFKENRQES